MEHITVKRISAKVILLTPDSGYVLVDKRTGTLYSEAFVRPAEQRFFHAEVAE